MDLITIIIFLALLTYLSWKIYEARNKDKRATRKKRDEAALLIAYNAWVANPSRGNERILSDLLMEDTNGY